MIRHHQSVSVCATARRSKTRNTKKTTTKEKMNFGSSSYIKCVKENRDRERKSLDFWEMWRDQQLPNVPYPFSSSSLNFPFVFYFRIYQEILDQHRDRAGKCLERQNFSFLFPPPLHFSLILMYFIWIKDVVHTPKKKLRNADTTRPPSLLFSLHIQNPWRVEGE